LDYNVKDTQHMQQNILNRWIPAHNLTQHNDLSWWNSHALVVVENNDLRRGVASLFHNSITAGHPGIAKTLQLAQQHYWWPAMKWFITDYIRGCATCQMHKVNTKPTKPLIFPIAAEPDALPFETIALDLSRLVIDHSSSYDSR
jgi:hypothetical protein